MEKYMGLIISGFIAILIGISFLTLVTDQTKAITNYQQAYDSLTWKNGTNLSLTYTYVNFLNIKNSSGSILGTGNYTLFTSNTGVVYCKDNTTMCKDNQVCYVTYEINQTNYIQDGTSRNILNLSPLLFAIAVLGTGVAMVYVGFKEADFM